MLLQTNSYIVPRDKRVEHARLLRRFRQTLLRLGLDHFEVYEQVGANWATGDTGRFVQIMRFNDRKHQLAVQMAERSDPSAQTLLREFCELINLPYQQQQGLFAVGYYTSFLRMPTVTHAEEGVAAESVAAPAGSDQPESAAQPAGEIASGEEPVAEAVPPAGENGEAVEPSSAAQAAVESDAAEIAGDMPTPETEQSAPEGEEQIAATEYSESEAAENTDAEPVASESSGENEAAEPLSPEIEIPDGSLPDASVADETAAPLGLIGLDDGNEDSMKHESGEEIPLESEGIDVESVFLGTAEEDPDHPGEIRPLHGDDDEEAPTRRPRFPSNS